MLIVSSISTNSFKGVSKIYEIVINTGSVIKHKNQRRTQNPVKHIKWSSLQKYFTAESR